VTFRIGTFKIVHADKSTYIEQRRARARTLRTVVEIERRLIPTGPYVFGEPGDNTHADMLRMVASFDRPEFGTRALPELIAVSLHTEERERIDDIAKTAVQHLLSDGVEAAASYLDESANVNAGDSRPMLVMLDNISKQLQSNAEVESLLRGLRGEFIEPGPGADIVQNPAILPTGRNTHAINPYLVPSTVALARGDRSQSFAGSLSPGEWSLSGSNGARTLGARQYQDSG
jgi:cobalamin biosynthesis Mg chelatase CobN